MQQSNLQFYCFVVQTLLNMFRALLCPSSGARQTAVTASGFRMNVEVEVFSAVVGLLVFATQANRPRLRNWKVVRIHLNIFDMRFIYTEAECKGKICRFKIRNRKYVKKSVGSALKIADIGFPGIQFLKF